MKLDEANAGWFEFSTTRNSAALPAQARIRISENLIHWQDLPVDGNPNIVVTEDSANRHAVKISPTTSPHVLQRRWKLNAATQIIPPR